MESRFKPVINVGDLRVIVLKTPYDIWNYPEVGSLFVKMVSLKLSGYLTRYRDGVLPLDTTDFVASHLLLARGSGEALELISALKIITAEECERYKLPFSALQVARGSGATEHAEVVEEFRGQCKKEGRPLSYVGSWTIAPGVRENRELSAKIRDISVSLVVNYHLEFGISDVIACGAPRVKSDRTVRLMGLTPLCKKGVELASFNQSSLQGEEAVMMSARGFSVEAKELAKVYSALWKNRWTIERTEDLKLAA